MSFVYIPILKAYTVPLNRLICNFIKTFAWYYTLIYGKAAKVYPVMQVKHHK